MKTSRAQIRLRIRRSLINVFVLILSCIGAFASAQPAFAWPPATQPDTDQPNADQPTVTQPAPTQPTAAQSSSVKPTILNACSDANVQARALTFAREDGAVLEGALLGDGETAVVLLNQEENDVCGWLPFLRILPEEVSTLLFLYGAQGTGERTADVVAALEALRERGFEQFVLIGAEQGANLALKLGAQAPEGIRAVVSFSAEDKMLTTRGEAVAPHVERLTLPVLFVAAEDDPQGAAMSSATYFERAPTEDKMLIIMPGSANGIDLLAEGGLEMLAVDFLKRFRARSDPL